MKVYKSELGVLHQGDCLDLMPMFPDKSIDMILCDLPYGTTACKWDTIIPFEPLWKEYKRIIKDNGAIVLTASQPFTSALIMSNIKMFKRCLYWKKERGTGFARANKEELRVIEEILIFGGKIRYFPIMKKLKKSYKHCLPINKSLSDNVSNVNLTKNGERIYKEYTHSYPTNLLEFSRDSNKLHPTQKPVVLFEYLIKTYTNEGEVVLDNCMGSGTTAVACENLKHRWIGMEKEKKYCDVIVNRLEERRKLKNKGFGLI